MKKVIIIYSVICLLLLYAIEQVFRIPYIIKTIIKIPMLTLLPFIINHYLIKSGISLKIKRSEHKFILLWAILVFIITFTAAYALKSFIDVEAVSFDFSNRMMLSTRGMILAGVYTIIVNSLIEEYFFRGYIFQGLLKQGLNKSAYIISSGAFAFYHVSIFKAWFGIGLMMVMLFGLFAGGLIFAYFVKRTESILSSWFIHISADIALIIIGVRLLGILG